jgi:hypothetical protein
MRKTTLIPPNRPRRHSAFLVQPAGALAWASDRERLWNVADRAEDRANGRFATELQITFPRQLDAAQRRKPPAGSNSPSNLASSFNSHICRKNQDRDLQLPHGQLSNNPGLYNLIHQG